MSNQITATLSNFLLATALLWPVCASADQPRFVEKGRYKYLLSGDGLAVA